MFCHFTPLSDFFWGYIKSQFLTYYEWKKGLIIFGHNWDIRPDYGMQQITKRLHKLHKWPGKSKLVESSPRKYKIQ